MPRYLIWILAAGCLVTVLGCGGSESEPAPTEPSSVLTSIEVTPSSITLDEVGETVDFDATARDQNGNVMSGVEFTWSSSDPTVATVDENGRAEAESEGEASISAEAEGVTGTSSLTVDPALPRPQSVTTTLPARFYASAVWDPNGERLLVHGGSDRRTFSDTWAYRPGEGTWTGASGDGPVLKSHVAAWAEGRNEMYVFGGNTGEEGFSQTADLWRYDGETDRWTRLSASGGPDARALSAAAWDPERDQLLVFGGVHGDYPGVRGDLWAYRPDEDRWVELAGSAAGPSSRVGATAVWNPDDGELLVFGGRTADGRSQETWGYDPATDEWTRKNASNAPPSRFRHVAVWDARRGGMLIHGGCCGRGGQRADLWRYDPETNAWTEQVTTGLRPSSRNRHQAAWSSSYDAMLVYSGSADGTCFYQNDLWAYRPDSGRWLRLTPEQSERSIARMSHAAASLGGDLYAFGGCAGTRPDDVLLRIASDEASVQAVSVGGSRPTARNGATLVGMASRGELLLFGGRGESDTFGDVWMFDPEGGGWSQLDPAGGTPEPRFDHAAAWSEEEQRLYVYGGKDAGGGFLGDFWAYDPAANEWSKLSTPSELQPRALAGATWDRQNNQFLLYSGWRQDLAGDGGKILYHDVWAYRPADESWAQLTDGSSAPEHRVRYTTAWDEAEGRMLVFGGNYFPHLGGNLQRELWGFDPESGRWSLISSSGPTARTRHGATWDGSESRLVVLGGYGGPEGRMLDQIWTYTPSTGTWAQQR